jgi:uncharacterized RDD family membrane protein YckC
MTLGTLAALVRSGGLDAQTPVRDSAETDWVAAGQRLPDLFAEPPKARTLGWTDTKPHIWRRYGARLLDNMVVGLATWWIIGLVFYSVAPAEADAFFVVFSMPGGQYLDAFLTLLCAIPGNAALIGLTGLSIGKWIFGVRVLRDGRPIGFSAALVRELDIWVRGLACGVPLLTLATLFMSAQKLQSDRITPWDKRQGNTVVHRGEGTLATVGMMLAAGVLFVTWGVLRMAPELP